MRVCLFTDTLGDVNGVSRFVRAMAEEAMSAGCGLMAACSTRFEVPAAENLVNFRPRLAVRLPGYRDLEIAWPPARVMLAWARRMRPDVVHVSTPGPVGLVGRRAARLLGVPLVGVYHTDFPAYVGHLLEDEVCARAAAAYMGWFYRPFSRVLTRTRGYEAHVESLGVSRERIATLRAGIDAAAFDPAHQDRGVWARLGVPGGIKVLYVGRVSVEKGLAVLAGAWRMLEARGGGLAGEPPVLVVVGDGPYRAQMERDLAGCRARFLGFRHGAELSALYASADLFVFPSATDTLGQVVLEAQASGLAALVSDRGGPSGIIEDGVTGRVLPAGDAGVWARAMAELIGDEPGRQRMGGAARGAMQTRSITGSFEHFWALHQEAAGERGGKNGPPA